MSAAAKKLADDQRSADMAHHKRRVEWLEQDRPLWSCGTPVASHEQRQMLSRSQAYLANPDGGFNHCNCEPRCA